MDNIEADFFIDSSGGDGTYSAGLLGGLLYW